jgi:hypothetical protein
MTNEQHLITPSSELVQQWLKGCPGKTALSVAAQASQWGADQELEACCEYIRQWFADPQYRIAELRTARRPKPPSLKEEALKATRRFYANGHEGRTDEELTDDFHTIRRALEAL